MRRRHFLRLRERYRRQGKHFIYIDESGFELKAARWFGYAPRGKRVYGEISGQKRPCTSLLNKNSVVVLDNASFHKSAETKELIEQHGAKLLFLPPYSPDLNPIEHDFGALKKIREYNHEKSIDEIIRMYK